MQNRRAIFFLTLAVVLGVAAALAAHSWARGQIQGAPVVAVATRPLVVAKAELPVGAALTAADIEVLDWPQKYVPHGAFTDLGSVVGRVLRRPLGAGEPVLEPSLLPEGADAGLVAVIESDKRAVSVKVDPVIGVAGFVKPGSRVDVLATLRKTDPKGKIESYSKVILQDVPVLAIDQRMEERDDGKPQLVSVVTLEVGPDDAQRLTYSAHEGRLQLALRNPTDRELVETSSVNAKDLLPGEAPRRNGNGLAAHAVEVVRGAQVTRQSF
jgi:pilus assembly protein CpaB